MPRYRVLEKSFLNNRIHEEGAEVEFDGNPGSNLEPLDAAARKAVAEYAAAKKARNAKLATETPDSTHANLGELLGEMSKQLAAHTAALNATLPQGSADAGTPDTSTKGAASPTPAPGAPPKPEALA